MCVRGLHKCGQIKGFEKKNSVSPKCILSGYKLQLSMAVLHWVVIWTPQTFLTLYKDKAQNTAQHSWGNMKSEWLHRQPNSVYIHEHRHGTVTAHVMTVYPHPSTSSAHYNSQGRAFTLSQESEITRRDLFSNCQHVHTTSSDKTGRETFKQLEN